MIENGGGDSDPAAVPGHQVSPELMCDCDWMVEQIADMHPLFEPGTKSGYMAYTFGCMNASVPKPQNTSNKR